MGTPFLLLQTPRAGTHNLRYLVSPAANLDSTAAAALLERAWSEQSAQATECVGPKFLSVRRLRQQPASGRWGWEILLLGNLRRAQRTATPALGCLRALLERIPEVLTDPRLEQALLSEHERLGEWLREDFEDLLHPPRRWPWLAAIACVVGVLAAACRWASLI